LRSLRFEGDSFGNPAKTEKAGSIIMHKSVYRISCCMLGMLLLASCSTGNMTRGTTFEDVPFRQEDLRVEGLPEECDPDITFFFRRIWAGEWHGATVNGITSWGAKVVLAVEKYVDSENITVYYAWKNRRGGVGKQRYKARIKQNRLEVYDSSGKNIRWRFKRNGDGLEGMQDNTEAKSQFPFFYSVDLRVIGMISTASNE
jgi:hypothetical protein